MGGKGVKPCRAAEFFVPSFVSSGAEFFRVVSSFVPSGAEFLELCRVLCRAVPSFLELSRAVPSL